MRLPFKLRILLYFTQDVGWVVGLWVGDITLLSVGIMICASMFINPISASGWQSPSTTSQGTDTYPPAVYPFMSLVIVLVHIIVREMAIPYIRRKEQSPASIQQGNVLRFGEGVRHDRELEDKITSFMAKVEAQREEQLRTNDRFERNIGRLFRRTDSTGGKMRGETMQDQGDTDDGAR